MNPSVGTIQGLAETLIRRGLGNSAIVAQVKRDFPTAKTNPRCISWYRANLKKREGVNPPAPRPQPRTAWPEWEQPGEAELLQLAHLTTRYVRFLHPEIIRLLVEDTEKNSASWYPQLIERHIEPASYMWPRSACAFPGVRRAGAKELDRLRNKDSANPFPADALDIDSNAYPKHIWSYVFRGRRSDTEGPPGYSLAHLADHKKYKDRGSEEFEGTGATTGWRTLPGLFTSPATTVFMPVGLIRPTDFAFPLRNLLQRRAAALYGEFCNLVPPGLSVRPGATDAWALDAFEWPDPVGSLDKMRDFLTFRAETIERLLRAR